MQHQFDYNTDKVQIVILDDDIEDYKLIIEAIEQTHIGFYPTLSDNSINKFSVLLMRYVIENIKKGNFAPHNDFIEREKQLKDAISSDVKLFILDLSLMPLENSNFLDYTGGLLRRQFLKKFFPNVSTLYLSDYSKDIIINSGCFLENDYYLSKDVVRKSKKLKKSNNILSLFLNNF